MPRKKKIDEKEIKTPEIKMDYSGINHGKMEQWLESNWGTSGFTEYFKYRDFQLLKNFAIGLEDKNYWINVGRRLELLNLVGRSKEVFEKMQKKSITKKGATQSGPGGFAGRN